ncbi:MAG: glutamine synthetase [Candidatus Aminicenantes bacterium RBG_13_63_10]|nr:MAG: glutamine synthetase [Candidatus Aminicenantes bacterium RBG_13_63_10]
MADRKTKKTYFALSNPLSVLLDKDPQDFRRADLLRILREKNIERITFHYTALDGKLKELKLPAVDIEQAECLLAEGERADGSSLFRGMVDMGLSDVYVVPVYKTAFLNPFDDRSLDFVCRYLTKDGEPAPFALDNILARAAALFRGGTGLDIHALGELEFFVLGEDGANIYPAAKQRSYHGSAPFIKSGHLLDEMLRHIAQITGAVKYGHSEVGFVESVRSDIEEIRGKRAEQLEVEFQSRPVEDMADALVLGRWLIRNIAFRRGCVVTFTPKIEEGVAGNGLHFHLELLKSGRNIMTGPDGKLSSEARRLIGGLCHYADSLTAFGNTVSSAYLRLVPNQEAPTRICWSDLNRSAMVRVPLGWTRVQDLGSLINQAERSRFRNVKGRQTVELRSPDGSALIHLLLAGIVMAADWAFRGDRSLFKDSGPLELADRLYVTGNIFNDAALLDRLPVLPNSCVASSRILLQKRDLYERDGVFPPSVIDYVAKVLAEENDEFMNEKLADLPSDDRLHETRRIMHKDLHRH